MRQQFVKLPGFDRRKHPADIFGRKPNTSGIDEMAVHKMGGAAEPLPGSEQPRVDQR